MAKLWIAARFLAWVSMLAATGWAAREAHLARVEVDEVLFAAKAIEPSDTVVRNVAAVLVDLKTRTPFNVTDLTRNAQKLGVVRLPVRPTKGDLLFLDDDVYEVKSVKLFSAKGSDGAWSMERGELLVSFTGKALDPDQKRP